MHYASLCNKHHFWSDCCLLGMTFHLMLMQDCCIKVYALSTFQCIIKTYTIYFHSAFPACLTTAVKNFLLCPYHFFCLYYHIHYSSCVVITVVKYSIIMGIRAKINQLKPPPARLCAVMSLRWRALTHKEIMSSKEENLALWTEHQVLSPRSCSCV